MDTVFKETLISMMTISGPYSNTYMFYGHMIAKCKRIMDTSMKAPAAVSFQHDKVILYINPLMFNKFTLEERLGVLKHEMLHILNGHLLRLKDKERKGWNYATDCAINQLIEKFHLPNGCIFPENLRVKPEIKKVPENQNAEAYYDMLDDKENPSKGKGSGNGEKGNGDCSNSSKEGYLLDDHDKWDESVGDSEFQKDIVKKMIEESINNSNNVHGRGSIPVNISELLKIHTRTNEVDWRKVLRSIVGNKKANIRRTLLRRDRRMPDRMDIKGKTKDRTFELLVVADVSGSVSNKRLIELIAEIQNICTITKTPVNMIQVDSYAHPPEKLSKTATTISRKGSGGTYLSDALSSAKKHKLHYDAVVIATDGGLSLSDVLNFERLNKPIIWLIEHTGRIMSEMTNKKMRAFKLKGK